MKLKMNRKRIRNTVLAIGAGLGLFSLGCALSPTTQAIPKTQYKAVRVMNGQDVAGNYLINLAGAGAIEIRTPG